MNKTTFERDNDENLIVLDCKINKHKVFLVLDSGTIFKKNLIFAINSLK